MNADFDEYLDYKRNRRDKGERRSFHFFFFFSDSRQDLE